MGDVPEWFSSFFANYFESRVKMGLSSKFLFFLIVCFTIQTIYAWPPFGIFRWKTIEYDINRAADDAERDVRKDLLSIKNKAWKEATKILRKARNSDEVTECLMQAHEGHLTKTDEAGVRAVTCIETVRGEVRGIDETNGSPQQLITIKNELKNRVKSCRNVCRNELKGYQKEFSINAEKCLYGQRSP